MWRIIFSQSKIRLTERILNDLFPCFNISSFLSQMVGEVVGIYLFPATLSCLIPGLRKMGTTVRLALAQDTFRSASSQEHCEGQRPEDSRGCIIATERRRKGRYILLLLLYSSSCNVSVFLFCGFHSFLPSYPFLSLMRGAKRGTGERATHSQKSSSPFSPPRWRWQHIRGRRILVSSHFVGSATRESFLTALPSSFHCLLRRVEAAPVLFTNCRLPLFLDVSERQSLKLGLFWPAGTREERKRA